MRKLLILNVVFGTTLIISSCQKTLHFCESIMPQLKNDVPFTILSESGDTVYGEKICTTKEAEWGPEYGEVMSLDPQGTVIYPGAVLNFNSFQDGTYIPISGNRKPIKISMSLSNITGDVSREINEPSLSSVREATQEILQSKTGGATAAKISWQQSEIYSQEHFKLAAAGNYGNLFYDINANYNYNSNEIIGRFLFQFTQEYYSIDMDAPQPGIDNFFEEETNCSQVGGISPVWVSSVKYGRKVFLIVESKEYDYSHMGEIQGSFDAFFSSGGLTVETTLSKLITEKSIKGVIIGGPAYEGIKTVTNIENLNEYLLAGANFNENSPGVPLSYNLRFVNDNSVAKLVLYDKFLIRDCKIIPPTTASFQPEDIKDIRLNHTKGDNDFDGHGPKANLITTLYISSNKKEVWARISLTMEETVSDSTTGERIYETKLWTCPNGKKINNITSKTSQTHTYTDDDHEYDDFYSQVSEIISHVRYLGDTDGDDLELSDIETTAHLHLLEFNRVSVELIDE